MNLNELIQDWGGFEDLVKELHDDGTVSVQRDVTLTGKSGATRQIDVLMKHNKGPYEYLTLIECKFLNRSVERSHVDVLEASMKDLNASKGVIFTTVGFQKGAESYAKANDINIFVIRDLTDEEWGLPGKIIDFYLQILSKSILDIQFPNTTSLALEGGNKPKMGKLELYFGEKNSINLIHSSHKEKYRTLESYLEDAAHHAAIVLQKKAFLVNHGDDCTRYFQIPVNMPLEKEGCPLEIMIGNDLVFVPEIKLQVGIRVDQSRMTFDRSEHFLYTLAIEDQINKEVYAATKKENSNTNWVKLNLDENEKSEDALQKGSIISCVIGPLFDPSEMKGLKEGELINISE